MPDSTGFDTLDWPLSGLFTHKAFKCQKCEWTFHWIKGGPVSRTLKEHRETHQ